MPRQRRGTQTPQVQPVQQAQVVQEPQTPNTPNTQNTRRGTMSANAIDSDKIASLLASKRSRGTAGQSLKEFFDSGESGVEVSLTEGRFKGKTAKQVVTALNNAKKSSNANGLVFERGADILIATDKDEDGTEHVYIIDTSK